MFKLNVGIEKTFTNIYAIPTTEEVNRVFDWFKELKIPEDTKVKAVGMFLDIMKMVEDDIERSKNG